MKEQQIETSPIMAIMCFISALIFMLLVGCMFDSIIAGLFIGPIIALSAFSPAKGKSLWGWQRYSKNANNQ
jgi:hypothetical protein